jgi:F-type H+-transporting ATPase subunit gamma
MKLVAGVKLKKAEQKAAESREYASEVELILAKIRQELSSINCELFFGRKIIQTEMLVVFASDKGLCGNFNYVVCKKTAEIVADIHRRDRKVRIICIGIKAFDAIGQRLTRNDDIELVEDFYRSDKLLVNAQKLAQRIIANFTSGNVDRVSTVYTKCLSTMNRLVEARSLIPLDFNLKASSRETIFEPNPEAILEAIVPHNIGIQLYQAALESMASEYGSRMAAMDNATRNADDLLSDLTIAYNRTRQYNITQELVEVVSGAAAIAKG